MSMSSNALYVRDFTKTINRKVILKDCNMTITKGEICSLFGKNGTGKSLFLHCILGFTSFDSGLVKINGYDITKRIQIRRYSGFVPTDDYSFCELLTPNEYFSFIKGVFSLSEKETSRKIEHLSEKLSVKLYLDELIENLSFGTRKKIVLMGILLYDPVLLVCDEIFEGLDAPSVQAVREIFLEKKKRGHSILFTSHLYQEAIAVSDRCYQIINKTIKEDNYL
ncbi:ATP-binding cassette domain-containing protein [Anoxybacteroides tepidamans]|uniref:ATP-binding cassette domain-containing protein n=1 Tax=Anoxybacteroides tepidamans TaxID=265948 RepID=UPI0004886DCB|nr:ABC transporter ATP-binding protein [Anoxybacillus tepidamans]